MASLDEIEQALRNAHAAGDTVAAGRLAAAYQEALQQSAKAEQEGKGFFRTVDDAVRGAADTLTFGLADEFAAGMGSLTGIGGESGDYDANLAAQRERDADGCCWRTAGQLGGAVASAVLTGPYLASTKAIQAGAGLAKTMKLSALEGGAASAIYGLGSGSGPTDRATQAVKDGVFGAALGGAAPVVVSGARSAATPFVDYVRKWRNPQLAVDATMQKGLKQSGQTSEEVVSKLGKAEQDGQGMYNVADALGHAGQRRLSALARTLNDARQRVVDTLIHRQTGQGERLSTFVADAFDAPVTAAQHTSKMKAARKAAADVNYTAARDSAGAVDVSGSVALADANLSPGVAGIASNNAKLSPNSVEEAIVRTRGFLTDGRSLLTDFKKAFLAKREIDAMIEQASPTVQGQLIPIRNALDDALADASPNYARARNEFRAQSKAIDAVETGQSATSSRTRAADNIATFNGLTPDEQAAFRVGYADPVIAKVEAASASPSTNKVRILRSEKTNQEFPAFAAPGKGGQLERRLDREQRMFETTNAAIGGSKTADNIADAADLKAVTLGLFGSLLQQNYKDAAMHLASLIMSKVQPGQKTFNEMLADALLNTNSEAANSLFVRSAKALEKSNNRRAVANSVLLTGQAPFSDY